MVADAIYKNSFRGEVTLPEGKWASAGNVGIVTDTPSKKLSVKGKIRAQEIKVETANWPDYVFEEGYKLPSLAETTTFIEKNKHLLVCPRQPRLKKKDFL
ncbi:hypothetical protein BCY89_20460 [Sphingobacterium siyangense]|uniref:Uncharacterized protein n=1 Tax=Sphingobacterium siyangense TaxID=459529 RepID=A0A420FB93_9SPHI|nr:hypothetical protein [Sphingobacterium siyangense]RKF30174.1 hypothetical protein BCY89_20460 [Sphingobacterium siyangense]